MSSAVRSEVSKPENEQEAYDKDMQEPDAHRKSPSRSPSRSPRDHRTPRSPDGERHGYSPAQRSSPARRFIRPVSGNYGTAGGNNNPRAPIIDVLSKFPMTCHFWKNNSCIKGAEKCSYIHGFVCRDDPNCKRGNACRDVHVKLQRFQKNNARDQRGRFFDHKPGYGVGYRRDDGFMRPNRGGRGNFHARRFQREDHRPFHESFPRRSRERDSWNDDYRRNQAEYRGRERLRSRSRSREEGFVRHRSRTPQEKYDRYRSRSLSKEDRTQRNNSRSVSRDRSDRRRSRSLSSDKRSYRSQSRSPKRSKSRSRTPPTERRSYSSSRSSSNSSRGENFRTGKRRSRSSERLSRESRSSSVNYKLHSLLDSGRTSEKSKHRSTDPKKKETLATMDPDKAASLLKDDMELSEGTIEKLMDSLKAKNKDTSAERPKPKTRPHEKDQDEYRRTPLFPISVPPVAPPPPKVSAKDLDPHMPAPSHRALGAEGTKDVWTPALERSSYDPRVTGVALSRWEIETPMLHRDEDGEGPSGGDRGTGRSGQHSPLPASGGVSAARLSTELDSLFSNTFDKRDRRPAQRRSISPRPGAAGEGPVSKEAQHPQSESLSSKRYRSDSSESSSSEGSDDEGKRDSVSGGDQSKSALIMRKSTILKNMQMLVEQKQRLDSQKEDLTKSHRGSDDVLQGILSENALLNEEITKQLQNMCTLIEELDKSIETAPEKDDDVSASKGKLKKTKKKTRKKRKKEKRSKDASTPQSADKKVSRNKSKLSKEKSRERDEEELVEEKAEEAVAKSPVVAPRYWDLVKPLSLSVTDEASAVDHDVGSPGNHRNKDYYDVESPRDGSHRADYRHRDGRDAPGNRNRRFEEGDHYRRREGSWDETRDDAACRDGQRWFNFDGNHWRNDLPHGEFRREMKNEDELMRGNAFPEEMARGARTRDDGRGKYLAHRREFGFRRGYGRGRPAKEDGHRRQHWEDRDRDANQHDRNETYKPEKFPEASYRRSRSVERSSRECEDRYRSYSAERLRDSPDRERSRKHNFPDAEEGLPSGSRSGSGRGYASHENERPSYRPHDEKFSNINEGKNSESPESPGSSKNGSRHDYPAEKRDVGAATPVKSEKVEGDFKIKAEQCSFIDQGMHWCKRCSVFCETLQLFAEHLQSAPHLDKLNKDQEKFVAVPECLESEELLQGSHSRPLVGVEFMQSVVALFCSLCRCHVSASGGPERHLHSAQHISNYESYVHKQPLYESTFLKAKMNAYANFMMAQSQPDKAIDSAAITENDASFEMEPPLPKTRAAEFSKKDTTKDSSSRTRDKSDGPRSNTDRLRRFPGKFEGSEMRVSTRSHFESDRGFTRFDRLGTERAPPRVARQYRAHLEEEDPSHPRKTSTASPKSKFDTKSKRMSRNTSDADSNSRRSEDSATHSEARHSQQSIRVVARGFGTQSKTDDEKSEPETTTKSSDNDFLKQASKKSVNAALLEMETAQIDETEKMLEELKRKVASRSREKREAQSLKDEQEARLREKEEKEARKKLEEKLDKFAKKQPVVEEKKNHSRFPLIGKMPFFKSKPMKSVSGKAAKDSDSSDKDGHEQQSEDAPQPSNGSALVQDIQDPKFVRDHSDELEVSADSPRSTRVKTNIIESLHSQTPSADQGSGNSKNQGNGVQNQLLKVLAMNKQRSGSPGNTDGAASSSSPAAESVSSVASSNPNSSLAVPKLSEPNRPGMAFPTYSAASEAPAFQTFLASPVTCVPSFVRSVPPPTVPLASSPDPRVSIRPPPMTSPRYSSPVALQTNSLPALGLPDYTTLVNRPPPPPRIVASPASVNPTSADSRDQCATPPPPGTEAGDEDKNKSPPKPSPTSKKQEPRRDEDENLLPPGIDPPDVEDVSADKTDSRSDGSGLSDANPLDSVAEILAHAIPTKAQIETRLAEAGQLLAKK